MKRTRALLGDRGASFTRYFAAYPLCCPARTTWITGQYPHNHGVIDNRPASGGGYEHLREPERVLPAWLDAAGYDTGLAGKWIHNYEPLTPPPGWDRWWGLVPATATAYYDYSIADSDGGMDSYGSEDSDYQTDVLTREYALPFIAAHATDPDPFFLHLSYTAPHWGSGRRDRAGKRCASPKPFSFDTARAKPAPRHAERFRTRELPRPPSFDERDARRQAGDPPQGQADPPRRAPRDRPPLPLRARQPARGRRRRGGDRPRARPTRASPRAPTSSSPPTTATCTASTGSASGKLKPYEEAIRVPLLIRGPGVAARRADRRPGRRRRPRADDRRADRGRATAGARAVRGRELARRPPGRSARPRAGDPDRGETTRAGDRERCRGALVHRRAHPPLCLRRALRAAHGDGRGRA